MRGAAIVGCLVIMLAAPVRAGVTELPVDADVCAIMRALAGASAPGCGAPESLGGVRAGVPGVVPPAAIAAEQGYFVHFDFDSASLTEAYRRHLDRLALVLSAPGLSGLCVRLVGHADSVGDAGYNLRLSLSRAEAVNDYLAASGRVGPERLSVDGMGEEAPLPGISGDDPRNRRVEILVREPAAAGCG
ncbi:MAG: OmpA family protein [Alphaproteobacteria bacterium]|nr:MAG: OmpA family protein [Alphaproteobacteria bacterium]